MLAGELVGLDEEKAANRVSGLEIRLSLKDLSNVAASQIFNEELFRS